MGHVACAVAIVPIVQRIGGIGGVQRLGDDGHISLAAGEVPHPAYVVRAAHEDGGPAGHGAHGQAVISAVVPGSNQVFGAHIAFGVSCILRLHRGHQVVLELILEFTDAVEAVLVGGLDAGRDHNELPAIALGDQVIQQFYGERLASQVLLAARGIEALGQPVAGVLAAAVHQVQDVVVLFRGVAIGQIDIAFVGDILAVRIPLGVIDMGGVFQMLHGALLLHLAAVFRRNGVRHEDGILHVHGENGRAGCPIAGIGGRHFTGADRAHVAGNHGVFGDILGFAVGHESVHGEGDHFRGHAGVESGIFIHHHLQGGDGGQVCQRGWCQTQDQSEDTEHGKQLLHGDFSFRFGCLPRGGGWPRSPG